MCAAKEIKNFCLCCFFVLFVCVPVCADEPYCQNLGFELGNFTNWTGFTWRYSTDVPSINTSPVQGIVFRRHTIMTDTTAYDVNTGYALRKVPSGYKYSCRLGDAILSGDTNPRGWEQSLRYTMVIDSTNALLILKFACVLQYASDHTEKMEPRFRVTLFDSKGDTIHDCANYDVYSSSANVKGFQSYTPSGSISPVKWRDWTTVGANLLKYIGQTITVEFMSADCTGRYHYGYAYFVAKCLPMYITVKYCSGDSKAVLTGPNGFETYKWTDSNGNTVGSSQILTLANPAEGATYYCEMNSATGCSVTLHSTIARYEPKAAFSSYMLDCFSNKVQFTNLSTATHGTLTYKWDFKESKTSTSTLKDPQYSFASSGLHPVSLILANPPSTCADTLNKTVESFSPPLVGIKGYSTYCPGETTTLKAYGAYFYTWSNKATTDSIKVGAPGGKYWMIGHSSTGCISDTAYITVKEEPDWVLALQGNPSFCKGNSSTLTASGDAINYVWNTGDKTSSIVVKTSGGFTVTGTNARGCQKSEFIEVTERPLPSTDFTLSATTVDKRHNTLSGASAAQTDVQYEWDMGDGKTESGANINHFYNVSNLLYQYKIHLTATTQYNCVDTASQYVGIDLFIPNVFTPNGDDINDIFMSNVDLQVFDRHGLILYKGTAGWNGTYKEHPMAPDTYFYLIRYTDRNRQEQTRKGFITLVR
ncbi:MAG: gliding motility-associated C-terminal domain-containing protein [Bacteroidota bacterium]|nr:gliding motility-associated C-terminal domain-containing protein [Bacteroidota bacterium]